MSRDAKLLLGLQPETGNTTSLAMIGHCHRLRGASCFVSAGLAWATVLMHRQTTKAECRHRLDKVLPRLKIAHPKHVFRKAGEITWIQKKRDQGLVNH